MEKYNIVTEPQGWKVIDGKIRKDFKSKKSALDYAKHILSVQRNPLVVHLEDGKVITTIAQSTVIPERKILSANVKRKLNKRSVRNAIAEVIFEKSNNEL